MENDDIVLKRKNIISELLAILPLPDDEILDAMDVERAVPLLKQFGDALQALKPLLDETCIEPLLYAFGYGDAYGGYWTVLHMLESLLEKHVSEEVFYAAVIQALQYGHAGSRLWAAYLIGRTHDPKYLEPLLTSLHDPKQQVRENVIQAIQMLGDARAIPALQEVQKDPDPKIRKAAQEAIATLQKEGTENVPT